MIPLTVDQIGRVVEGEVHGDRGARVTAVSIDSRRVAEGHLFAALEGEYFDGHIFAADAAARGAVAVLCEREVDAPTRVEVSSVLRALTTLGGLVRDTVDPIVVGVTGSTGKTSTKDLLAAVLSTRMRTIASERSFNNELGVPLTLLSAAGTTEVLVCELGAQRQGEIAELCAVVRPQIGLVTNVGDAHHEFFGSQEATATAKSELVRSLPESGTAVLNADDPWVAAMRNETAANILTYGIEADADVRAEAIDVDRLGRPRFRIIKGYEHDWVELSVSGRHQVPNALAAATAGLAAGLDLEMCTRGLERATLSEGRMKVFEDSGVRWIDDSYNANPASMQAALSAGAEMKGNGRFLAVLGFMAELGDIADEAHAEVGLQAATLLDRLVVVGKGAHAMLEAARSGGLDAVAVDDVAEAREALGDLREGDVVLVKASRVVGLERMLEGLGDR